MLGSVTVAESIDFRVGLTPGSATASFMASAKLHNHLLTLISSMARQGKDVGIMGLDEN